MLQARVLLFDILLMEHYAQSMMSVLVYHTHREQDSGTPFCIDMKGQSAVIYKVRVIYRGNRLVLPAGI